jgi:hypothetical protein
LKRKENALVLCHGSFVGQKIDWTDWKRKSDLKQDVRQTCGALDGLARELFEIK